MKYVKEVKVGTRRNRQTGEVRYKVTLRTPYDARPYEVLSAQFLGTPGEPQVYTSFGEGWTVYIYAADELQAAVRVNSALGGLDDEVCS